MITALAMSLGERAAYAGRMLLIGMGTVFVSLSILWGVLALFRMAVERTGKQGVKKASVADGKDALPSVQTADDGAVVAAIAAAISVMLAEENGGTAPAFRVVNFKRTGSTRP